MRWLSFITGLICAANSAVAQNWTSEVTQDEIYDAGRVALPGGMMTIACAAATGRKGVTPESRWWEVSVAPSWHYLVVLSDALVPSVPDQIEADLIIFANETGFLLPPVVRNELEGGWQAMVSMADPAFLALPSATRIVLQVGGATAWELPVAGLADGLTQAQSVCGQTWRAAGIPPPPRLGQGTGAGPASLSEIAAGTASAICNGVANLGPNAIQQAQIDGDGKPDYVLDYNNVTCGPQALRPNVCGMNTCSIGVFLSRTYALTGRSENMLGTSASIVPLSNGNDAVSASGNFSMCQSTEPCTFLFYWDGAGFKELPQ